VRGRDVIRPKAEKRPRDDGFLALCRKPSRVQFTTGAFEHT
jgi:hypothetical protein